MQIKIRQSIGSFGRWDKRIADQASDIQVFFFIISYRLNALKTM